MSDHLFGRFQPRLNVAPLLLTPGIAAIGYAIGGRSGAWWGIAAWIAVVLGAVVSCTLHAWRGANEEILRPGRRAFDYDAKNAGR